MARAADRAASAAGGGTGRLPALGPDDGENTLATRLVALLRDSILGGELAPGRKINLDQARRDLAVSLSPLREALARLTSTGLVALHDNRGYSVTPLSLDDLGEITRLRVALEGLALGHAIRRGDATWEAEVMGAVDRLNRVERRAADPASIARWESAHGAFHRALIAGSGMPLLLGFCDVLHDLNDRYRRILLRRGGGDRDVVAEHSAIARATVARDEDLAVARLRRHIERTGSNLRRLLDGTVAS